MTMMDSQPTPPTGNLRAELNRLERLLIDDAAPGDLRRLAEPRRLDFLFRLELSAILRTGPGAEVSPHDLLAIAQRAAAAGTLPLATPATLRRILRDVAGRLRDAGAWHPDRPLWWSPLPAPAMEEDLWRHAGDLGEALPPDELLAEAFSQDPGSPRWLSLPALVPAPLLRTAYGELDAAHLGGALGLERAGVGAGERISSRRSDSVLYLAGTESELLAAAPTFAAIAQWYLTHLGNRLERALPSRASGIFAPRKVMLARYPAPSAGYYPHLDNPGGEDDNGRTLTLVTYLNAPGEECAGGEIAVWSPGTATSAPPAAVLPASGGSAVLFDAREVAHRVLPVKEGPARWAMALWFSDSPQQDPASPPVPEPSLTSVLLPVMDPPLAAGRVLFHELGEDGAAGRISVRSADSSRPRVGIVATVYRGGAGLDAWCEHHLALGVDHLVLVFDRLEEPGEAADAERLAARHPPERLTVWSGSRLAAERWQTLSLEARGDLERFARSGAACWAVAARQTLNAGVALEAARSGELGGAPLDWLLHLDADELLLLEGAGRGGATLHEHFSAARDAGFRLLRYVNHELLHRPGAAPRFKRNPHLAAARLGAGGWQVLVKHLAMAQTDPRPYFTGYFNGKSAVAVAHAAAAAGVHGWRLAVDAPEAVRFLAGPSVLHYHFADAAAFRRKYLQAEAAGETDTLLFEPSPVEVTVFGRIRALRRDGADEAAVERGLDALHAGMIAFTDDDVELLEAAGLILEPEVDFHPTQGQRSM